MANLGDDTTPVQGSEFSLPAGAKLDEDGGDFVVRDSAGEIILRRDETAGNWNFEGGELRNIGSVHTEEVNTDSWRYEETPEGHLRFFKPNSTEEIRYTGNKYIFDSDPEDWEQQNNTAHPDDRNAFHFTQTQPGKMRTEFENMDGPADVMVEGANGDVLYGWQHGVASTWGLGMDTDVNKDLVLTRANKIQGVEPEDMSARINAARPYGWATKGLAVDKESGDLSDPRDVRKIEYEFVQDGDSDTEVVVTLPNIDGGSPYKVEVDAQPRNTGTLDMVVNNDDAAGNENYGYWDEAGTKQSPADKIELLDHSAFPSTPIIIDLYENSGRLGFDADVMPGRWSRVNGWAQAGGYEVGLNPIEFRFDGLADGSTVTLWKGI